MAALTVHVIGAGIAGLATAIALLDRGHRVIVHEASRRAGGRCRSFTGEDAGSALDLGTHVVLGANRAVFDFMHRIGSGGALVPLGADLPFFDSATGERWRIPLSGNAVFTGLKLRESGQSMAGPGLARLAWAMLFSSKGRTASAAFSHLGPFYHRFLAPFCFGVFNLPPDAVPAARLSRLIVQLGFGGRGAIRPHLFGGPLQETLIDPAVAEIRRQGGEIRTGDRLRKLTMHRAGWHAEFRDGSITGSQDTAMVLATPFRETARLVPQLAQSGATTAPIVNAHYFSSDFSPTGPHHSRMIGLTGGEAQWIVVSGRRISVTAGFARSLIQRPEAQILDELWREVVPALDLHGVARPDGTVFKVRHATALVPPAGFGIAVPVVGRRLLVAGGWSMAPLPDSLEASILSGIRAEKCLPAWSA